MENAAADTAPSPLDAKTLLKRIDRRIALLRGWISHDHRDEPTWWARQTTAAEAQRERAILRLVADLLHVERATQRGRIHGTRFATLEEQRTWIAAMETRRCAVAARYAGLPGEATLVLLREGTLPL
jgi:hypothetical protein